MRSTRKFRWDVEGLDADFGFEVSLHCISLHSNHVSAAEYKLKRLCFPDAVPLRITGVTGIWLSLITSRASKTCDRTSSR